MNQKKAKKPFNPDWERVSNLWKDFSYPWRPNPKQIAFYEGYLRRYLSQNPQPKVLILGCTPETRDLCAKLKLPLISFDINETMYHGMINLMQRKPYQEKFVKGRWEDVDQFFKKDQFDIIFSDETQNNMAIETWDKNFKDIGKILKKNGLYFCALLGMHFDKKITFKEVFRKYKNNPTYFNNYQNKLDIFYQLSLGEGGYDWKYKGWVLQKFRKKLKDFAKENKIPLKVISKIWVLGLEDLEEEIYGDYIEITPPLGEVYDLLVPYFRIKDLYIDQSHPVYRLRRDFVLKPKK